MDDHVHLKKFFIMNQPSVYKNYFENYTSLVNEKDVMTALANQQKIVDDFLNAVSEEKSTYAYAAGKWTLKEMLQHLIDTERIFGYRALAIARKETATLPGFDENLYAHHSEANRRTWAELSEEMNTVRSSTLLLFKSFTENMLQQTGNFSSSNGSSHTLGLIIVGHIYHHINIAKERYL